jgi:phosphate transport system substrate-binding protein
MEDFMKRILIAAFVVLVASSTFAQGKFTWIDPVSDDTDKMLPGVDPSKVKGDIITAGSSTVYPLSVAVAEQFVKEGYTGNVTIDSIGTGGGFERFGKGEIDVANASKAAGSKEISSWKEAGRDALEFRVATDAIAVSVSKKNTFVKDITKEELAKLFSTAQYWSDVRSTWPKKEILRYTPGTDSGTFDYFVEVIFKKDKKPILAAKNLNMSEDDNVLVQGIAGSEYAVGFFGFAYYTENRAKLNVLAVEGIAASAATVDAGTYPISRPLFLYTTAKIMTDKPQAAAFVDYYLTHSTRLAKKVGYFPAHADEIKKAKQTYLNALKGSY